MKELLKTLSVQRWDDHRYYHHSRINQSLHFISAMSFLVSYVLLFINPVAASFVAWLVAAVVGSALMHPAARKMRAASNADEAISYARRIALVGGAEIVLIVIGIWVMGAQPGS